GAYTRQMLQAASQDPAYGADFADRVLANVRSEELDVRALLNKIVLGEGDGGVVYATDVTPQVAPEVQVIAIPEAFNVIASYPIAVVQAARPRSASASSTSSSPTPARPCSANTISSRRANDARADDGRAGGGRGAARPTWPGDDGAGRLPLLAVRASRRRAAAVGRRRPARALPGGAAPGAAGPHGRHGRATGLP